MLVGAPKEIKKAERRVGLTPASVRELVAHGHEVLVESTAGIGIGAADDDYAAAGARIAPTAGDVWGEADLIVKVKEPQAPERAQIREDQVLFTYLHLAPDPDQTRELVDSGATCIAYETVTDAKGGLPLAGPDVEGGRSHGHSGRGPLPGGATGGSRSAAWVGCPASRRPRWW